ncbi:hypothetical protein IEQ_02027 [Bacillus cereus BAG6X1-2]|nr:hypothetical protein IEQ_02027 [Bacillus cereus BAG6X1-2]
MPLETTTYYIEVAEKRDERKKQGRGISEIY